MELGAQQPALAAGEPQVASGDLINCEHRGGRAGIEENPLQHKLLCVPAELDRNE